MPELTIQRKPTRTTATDYQALRQAGLSHIEKLCGEIWTDYNTHDPGITTLELLAYAITDLSRRTAYPIEDMLAGQSDEGSTLFSAREILSSHPVTQKDIRKILIDVPGVKNAWVQVADKAELPLFVDCKHSELAYVSPFKITEDVKDALIAEGINIPALDALLGEKFADEPAFRQALQAKLSAPLYSQYGDEIVATAQVFNTLTIRGLYTILLEMAPDELGRDRNDFSFEQTLQSETIEPFDIFLRMPRWDVFFNRHIRAADITGVKIDSLVLGADNLYSAKATFQIQGQPDMEMSCEIKSFGPLSTEVQNLIETALAETSATGLLARYRERLTATLEIAGAAAARLHACRSLCEDVLRLQAIDIEDIGICADIEVTADADIEAVLAGIVDRLAGFIAPDIPFYTLDERLAEATPVEEIFDGPALQHGFIKNSDIKATELREHLHVSDVIRLIMEDERVVAVKKLLASNFFKDIPLTDGEPWQLDIAKGRAMRFSLEKSAFTFYKNLLPFAPNKQELASRLAELRLQKRQSKLAKGQQDLPVPSGTPREISDYFSIQNEYPQNYGIGSVGLPKSATKQRKAQAQQFKGYLLFYDYLLSGYLAQLDQVPNLLSIKPELRRSYFTRVLTTAAEGSDLDIPDIQHVLKAGCGLPDDPANPLGTRDPVAEDQDTFLDRRNRLLDHLCARFNEQFTDYVLLMYTLEKKRAPEALIKDKILFLKDYPKISANRGKAYDAKNASALWDSGNVSGLQQRVCRLLGIESSERHSLAHGMRAAFAITEETDGSFSFICKNEDGDTLLKNAAPIASEAGAQTIIDQVIHFGRDADYFATTEDDGSFSFVLRNDTLDDIAIAALDYSEPEARDDALRQALHFLQHANLDEGFFLVEHLLLRPHREDDPLLTVCVPEDCHTCPGYIDPYSFRMSAVVPAWPGRFDHFDFRLFFEQTLRLEAPAHTHLKICWVPREEMLRFEQAYQPWLEAQATLAPDSDNYRAALKNLIETLESLRSIYPEATLHDCEDGDDENPVLLNQSILGSAKKANHEDQ